MNCPVTCGRPTRMSAEAFARMCAARRDKDNKYCADCNGRPPEVEVINMGGKAMASKTVKEQIAEALAPVKQQLDEAEARAERLSDECCDVWAILEGNDEGTLPKLAEKRMSEIKAQEQRIAELEAELNARNAELAAFRAAEAEPTGITGVDVLDMSANLYRDALADFAIRVLSGGVAVSFHEARP